MQMSDKERIEQLECQLAGCMTAATGWAKDPPVEGDWGWSKAFQDVLQLRARFENQRKSLESGLALVESAFAARIAWRTNASRCREVDC